MSQKHVSFANRPLATLLPSINRRPLRSHASSIHSLTRFASLLCDAADANASAGADLDTGSNTATASVGNANANGSGDCDDVPVLSWIVGLRPPAADVYSAFHAVARTQPHGHRR